MSGLPPSPWSQPAWELESCLLPLTAEFLWSLFAGSFRGKTSDEDENIKPRGGLNPQGSGAKGGSTLGLLSECDREGQGEGDSGRAHSTALTGGYKARPGGNQKTLGTVFLPRVVEGLLTECLVCPQLNLARWQVQHSNK